MVEANRSGQMIAVRPLGMALSAFLAISYILCIVGYLVLPGIPVKHEALSIFLPGFELLSWRTFLIGLLESYAWGWYVAVVFTPLYNLFSARR
jgi:hypothetical protein